MNLALLTAQAMHPSLLGSVWVVFVIIFWEGLLGGAVYVNTFAEIGESVAVEQREWSLGAVSVSDSAGDLRCRRAGDAAGGGAVSLAGGAVGEGVVQAVVILGGLGGLWWW